MNKLIEEIARQAEFYVYNGIISPPSTGEMNTNKMTKFAELIIKECIGDYEKKIKIRYAGDQKSLDIGYGMEIVIDSIKQKFGIL